MRLPDELDLAGGRLRAIEPSDWRLDHALSRVRDVPRWTYYPTDVTEVEAQQRVARSIELRRDGRGGRFVVESGAVAVGTIGFALRTDGPYLYYAFLPEGRGRGLATSAVLALTQWAFAEGEPHVHALTMLDNTASERVLERASFVRAGLDVEPGGATVTRWVTGP
ncbi:GNAT family N-acetyltransferase [Cellulomonas sp. URHE0023]|uniref:GNAT family N-acetyltransferase n=1 Tax=Cellulomonas sp. URHE0023 TaxID=1380354 RepID=UPI00068EB0D9|nr:GNAT family N-acetyltransferase [Cellulomonas sp. URHE0023]